MTSIETFLCSMHSFNIVFIRSIQSLTESTYSSYLFPVIDNWDNYFICITDCGRYLFLIMICVIYNYNAHIFRAISSMQV